MLMQELLCTFFFSLYGFLLHLILYFETQGRKIQTGMGFTKSFHRIFLQCLEVMF